MKKLAEMQHWQFTETNVYAEIQKIAKIKTEIKSNTNKNDKTT